MWDYHPEVLREALDLFRQYYRRTWNMDVHINITDYPWSAYAEKVTKRFESAEPTDVLYASGEWLAEWFSNGWITPLEDHFPELSQYKEDLSDLDLDGLSYEGKMLGLPYYADRFSFLYNEKVLRELGYDTPPRSWDEVLDQSLAIKSKGLMKYPMGLALGFGPEILGADPIEEYFSVAYSMCYEPLFDDELNALLGQGSSAEKTLTWIVEAVKTHEIIEPRCVEKGLVDLVHETAKDEHAFTILPSYSLKMINEESTHGQVKLAMLPNSGYTVGYTRSYIMSSSTLRRSHQASQAAWQLIEFLGGKTDPEETGSKQYYMAKKWAMLFGVNFAQKSVWRDPQIEKHFSKWLDLEVFRRQSEKVRSLPKVPWWRRWYHDAARSVRDAVRGKVSVATACKMMIESWDQLRSESYG